MSTFNQDILRKHGTCVPIIQVLLFLALVQAFQILRSKTVFHTTPNSLACATKCDHHSGHVLCTSTNFIVNNNCAYYNHREGYYKRKTRRGCKGGRRKHRKQQQITVVSSSRRYTTSTKSTRVHHIITSSL